MSTTTIATALLFGAQRRSLVWQLEKFSLSFLLVEDLVKLLFVSRAMRSQFERFLREARALHGYLDVETHGALILRNCKTLAEIDLVFDAKRYYFEVHMTRQAMFISQLIANNTPTLRRLTAPGLKADQLDALVACPMLEYLLLYYVKPPTSALARLSPTHLPNLHEICFRGTQTVEEVDHILSCDIRGQLRALRLSVQRLSEPAWEIFAKLKQFQQLERLEIDFFDTHSIDHVPLLQTALGDAFAQMKNLTDLSIKLRGGGGPAVVQPAVVWVLPQLRRLQWNETMWRWLPILTADNLESLVLQGVAMDENVLSLLKRCTKLVRLHVVEEGKHICDDEVWPKFCNLISEGAWPNLTELAQTVRFPPSITKFLAAVAARPLSKLKTLFSHIPGNRRLDGADFDCIRSVLFDNGRAERLESVSLTVRGESPPSPASISGSLSLPQLVLHAANDAVFKEAKFAHFRMLELYSERVHLSSLALVLDACPSLTALHISYSTTIADWTVARPCNLTHLKIEADDALTMSQLVALLKSCPKLESLLIPVRHYCEEFARMLSDSKLRFNNVRVFEATRKKSLERFAYDFFRRAFPLADLS